MWGTWRRSYAITGVQRPRITERIAPIPRAASADRTARVFGWVWLGQLLSLTGSALTGFGVGVWVYQHTGSVLDYALIAVFVITPGLLVAPWAGAWVDRLDRRRVMIAADSGAALCTGAMGLLLWLGQLGLWHIFVLNAVAAVCQAFQRPALLAAVTTLVPKDQLGRASGLIQLAGAVPNLVAPLLAAFLLGTIGLAGIIVLDLTLFLLATGVLLVVRFPPPPTELHAEVPTQRARPAAPREFAEAIAFIRRRPPLTLLMAYFALANFAFGLVVVLFAPIVLALHSEKALGTILTCGGIGMLAGSVLMSAWGGPRRRILGVLGFDILVGAALLVGGLSTSIPALCACAFVVMFCEPIIGGCDQTLWQHKVPPALQGRVFALREVFADSALPVAALTGGLLADRLFEPWLMPGGRLADSIGGWVGVGPGRGVGLMFVLAGALIMVLAATALLNSALRQIDKTLPDAH
jgi:DHA3 family macrolide efflux protein-like MFS transporter